MVLEYNYNKHFSDYSCLENIAAFDITNPTVGDLINVVETGKREVEMC